MQSLCAFTGAGQVDDARDDLREDLVEMLEAGHTSRFFAFSVVWWRSATNFAPFFWRGVRSLLPFRKLGWENEEKRTQ